MHSRLAATRRVPARQRAIRHLALFKVGIITRVESFAIGRLV